MSTTVAVLSKSLVGLSGTAGAENDVEGVLSLFLRDIRTDHPAAIGGSEAHAAQACAEMALLDRREGVFRIKAAVSHHQLGKVFDQEAIGRGQNAGWYRAFDFAPHIALRVVEIVGWIAQIAFRLRSIHPRLIASRIMVAGTGGLRNFERGLWPWHLLWLVEELC